MKRIDLTLLDALQLIADERAPKHGDPEFQSFGERVEEAKAGAYLSGSSTIQSKGRNRYGDYIFVEPGRLTAKGRELLASLAPSPPSELLQRDLNEFCNSRKELWAQRHSNSQRRAQAHAAGRGLINSSIHIGLRADASLEEGAARVREIKSFVIEWLAQSTGPIDGALVGQSFQRATKSATSEFRESLENLARERLADSTSARRLVNSVEVNIAGLIKSATFEVQQAAKDAESHLPRTIDQAPLSPNPPPIAARSSARSWGRFLSTVGWFVMFLLAIIAILVTVRFEDAREALETWWRAIRG